MSCLTPEHSWEYTRLITSHELSNEISKLDFRYFYAYYLEQFESCQYISWARGREKRLSLRYLAKHILQTEEY